MNHPRNPYLAVDAIIEMPNLDIVLIERKFKPKGYALPGGFVDYGESLEDAIRREVNEETGLKFTIEKQLHTYSSPQRDPRKHVVSVVFIGKGIGTLQAGDDAKRAILINPATALERNLVFDHKHILCDYIFEHM